MLIRLLIVLFFIFSVSCQTTSTNVQKSEKKEQSEQIGAEHAKFIDLLVKEFNNNHFNAFFENYDSKMREAFPADKSSAFLSSVFEKTGKIVEIERLYQQSESTYNYFARCQNAYLILTVSFLGDKIQGLWINIAPLKLTEYRKIAEYMVDAYNKKNYSDFMKFYNSEVGKALPLEKTKELIESFHTQLGAAKNINAEKFVGERNFVYPVKFEKIEMNLNLSFDKDDKIQGIEITEVIKPVKYPEITEKATVQEIGEAYIKSKGAAGVAIGIYQNGKTKFFLFGEKVRGSGDKIDENSLFEIGSITKTFTGAMLYQMVNEGKIKLEDQLQKYFADSVKIPKFEGSSKEIKIIDLATHTSSLPRMPLNFDKYVKDPSNPYKDYRVKHINEFMNSYKLEREIGSKYEYSNLGLAILGNVLADLDKKSYDQMVFDRILKPLGMTNTFIDVAPENKALARGHDLKGTPVSNWDLPAFKGAGAIESSVKDMLKYLEADINAVDSNGLISKEIFSTRFEIDKGLNIGLTWFEFTDKNNQKVYQHGGGTGGYSSFIKFSREKKIGVIVLSNSTLPADPLAEAVFQLLEIKNINN